MSKPHRRATWMATLVLLAGVTASLAGNLQAINLDNHRPGIGAYISAIIWPVFLFLAIEILLHTPWLANWRDALTKGMAVVLVGGVAAYVSYFHLAHVLSSYGYDVASRYAGPLAIDACMAMATLALNRVGQARRLAMATLDGQEVAMADLANAGQTPPWATAFSEVGQDVAKDLAPVDNTYAAMAADEAELAETYATVADEASNYLARLATHPDLDSTTTPAVPVVPGDLPQRKRTVKYDRDRAVAAILCSLEQGSPGAQIDQSVAEAFGISTRTARRLRSEVTGQPVSGPPSDSDE